MTTSYQNLLIQGLTSSEKPIIEGFLKKQGGNPDKEKYLLLFYKLISNPDRDFSEKELTNLVGSKENAFRTLKSRLFDKATEALTLDSNIQDASRFSEIDRAVFRVRKNYLILKIIFKTERKENSKILAEILNQTIVICKKYEIYDALVDILRLKQMLIGVKVNATDFDKINSEIKYYEYCTSVLYFTNNCFHKVVINPIQIKPLSNQKLILYISASIKKIQVAYRRTKSNHINFYLLMLQFSLAELKRDYELAINYCKKLESLVKNSKVIYKEDRMGSVNLNFALFYLFLSNYSASRRHIYISQKYFLKYSFNYFVSVEQEFLVEFYDKKYEAANSALRRLSKHSVYDGGEFRLSKYEYYAAHLYFAKRQFKDALNILNKPFEFEKDKTLWNIGLKILLIQTYIELNKFDEASRAIESLRKHVERHNKGGKIKKRDLLIIKTLREYEKEGFNYTLENKTIPKLLKTLAQKNKPISWEHKTPEMIPFHEWLENR